jgi:hypothetical protein
MLSPTSPRFLDSWIQELPYEGRRTESTDRAKAIATLAAALPDLTDYGTVRVNDGGGLTLPAPVRRELGFHTPGHWRVLGSPELGVALLVGVNRSPAETMAFLLGEAD